MASMNDNRGGDDDDHEDDSDNCDVCNIKFQSSKAYFAHIYSVSHLQRANAVKIQSVAVTSLPSVTSAQVTGSSTQVTGSSTQVTSSSTQVTSSSTQVTSSSTQVTSSSTQVTSSSTQVTSSSTQVTSSSTDAELDKIPLPGGPVSSSTSDDTANPGSIGKPRTTDGLLGTNEATVDLCNSLANPTGTGSHLSESTSSAPRPSATGNVSELFTSKELDRTPASSDSAAETHSEASAVAVESHESVPTNGEKDSVAVGVPTSGAATASVSFNKETMEVEADFDSKTLISKGVDELKDEMVPVLQSSFEPELPPTKEEVSMKAEDFGMHKLEVDIKSPPVPGLASKKPLLSPSNAGTLAPKIPLLGSLPAAQFRRNLPYSYEPLHPPVKVPLLGSPNGGFPPNPGFEPWSGGQSIPLLEPDPPFHHGSHGSKIPLLRSPVSPYGSFPPAFPPPGGVHHSGPLLPTPMAPVRGPVKPLLSSGHGIRAQTQGHWGPENSGLDTAAGVEVMDYHHGFLNNTGGAKPFHPAQRATEQYSSLPPGIREVEPLVIGNWIQIPKPKDDPQQNKNNNFMCHVCNVNFADILMHELHLAGLRHRMMTQNSFRRPAGSLGPTSESKAHASSSKAEDDACHSPAFVTGLLDVRSGSVASSSSVSSSVNSGFFSDLEKKLQAHSGPNLGVDYLTEYRYLGSRSEYTCDLCDLTLESVSTVVEHISSIEHQLLFMRYNSPEMYKTIAENSFDADEIKEAAEKLRKMSGAQQSQRVRVKLESDDVSFDGRFAWIDLKDGSVKPVSALPGHRLSNDYATVAPGRAVISVNDIYSLLRAVSLQSCLLAGRPPSQTRPLRRMDFLNALGKFEIRSTKDAEVCLQLANFLTIAVINFRRRMLPSLNAVDVTKIEEKLTTLHKNASVVATKTISSVSSTGEINLTRLELTSDDKDERSV